VNDGFKPTLVPVGPLTDIKTGVVQSGNGHAIVVNVLTGVDYTVSIQLTPTFSYVIYHWYVVLHK